MKSGRLELIYTAKVVEVKDGRATIAQVKRRVMRSKNGNVLRLINCFPFEVVK